MLGERLRDIRKERGMTQDELATSLNMSVHTVSSYERGKSEPDDFVKIKIAKLFNISLDYLLGLTDAKCGYVRSEMVLASSEFTESDREKIRDYAGMVLLKRKSEIRIESQRVAFVKH